MLLLRIPCFFLTISSASVIFSLASVFAVLIFVSIASSFLLSLSSDSLYASCNFLFAFLMCSLSLIASSSCVFMCGVGISCGVIFGVVGGVEGGVSGGVAGDVAGRVAGGETTCVV